MEPLTNAIRDLARRVGTMSSGARFMLVGVLALLTMVGVSTAIFSNGASYQYAFTNLTPEDSAEAGAALKGANIAFRTEANGSALAVPANQVHEARLLLAAAGLPRGAGVGFGVVDKGCMGAAEFPQRINLRRATEGELARTIG